VRFTCCSFDSERAKARDTATAVMLELGPGDKLDAAESAVIRAAERISTIGSSIVAVDTELQAMQQAEATRADRALREKTARDLRSRADRLEKLSAPVAELLTEAHLACEAAQPVLGEIGIIEFLSAASPSSWPAMRRSPGRSRR
jgi:hypothetical protein